MFRRHRRDVSKVDNLEDSELQLCKSDSNDSLEAGRRSAPKTGSKSDKRVHKEHKEEGEMNKILTALRFFKEQTNNAKNSGTFQIKKSNRKESHKHSKEKENIQEKDRAPTAEGSESRPRTSRGKRGSKARKKSGPSGGGNSALGFHSSLAQNPLLQSNIENSKHTHNRSVNVAVDSPRTKKKKAQKGRVSPNTFTVNHTRHPSAVAQHVNHAKNTSMEAEKLSLLGKNRPKSAKLRKKVTKSGERGKKGVSNRQSAQASMKNGLTSHNFLDSSIMEDNSFDNNDKVWKKFMKKSNCLIRKANNKLKAADAARGNKGSNSKFMVYKRPESSTKMAYENMSYIDDLQKMHNNVEELMKNKANLKFDNKKRKVSAGSKKKKNRRSATPALSLPQHYLGAN